MLNAGCLSPPEPGHGSDGDRSASCHLLETGGRRGRFKEYGDCGSLYPLLLVPRYI